LLSGSLIRWLAIRFIPPTFGTSPATKSQWWIQIVRQDAQLKEDYFMAADMEKNRQQGGQSGQSGQQSGQSGRPAKRAAKPVRASRASPVSRIRRKREAAKARTKTTTRPDSDARPSRIPR